MTVCIPWIGQCDRDDYRDHDDDDGSNYFYPSVKLFC